GARDAFEEPERGGAVAGRSSDVISGEASAGLVVNRGVPRAKQPRQAHARLFELDQDVPVSVGVDPLHVSPEERVDRRLDRIRVEAERAGELRRGAKVRGPQTKPVAAGGTPLIDYTRP